MTEKQLPAGRKPEKTSKKPRRRRRWPWILAGVFAVIFLILALLPRLLSLAPARRMILGRINADLNGSVHIDSWRLGWFSGFTFKGIRVEDAQGQTVVAVEGVRVPTGIPSLLSPKKELGVIEIESPSVNLVLYPDGSSNLSRILIAEGPAPPPTKEPAKAQPLDFDLAGQIVLRNGEVKVQSGDAPPFLVRELEANLVIGSLNEPIAFKLDARLGEGDTRLAVRGSAKVMEEGVPLPRPQESNVTASLTLFELAELAPLARQLGVPIDLGGKLDLQLSAKFKGKETLEAEGTVGIQSLTLAGGPLGKNQPQFESVRLDFAAVLDADQIKIQKFRFESPVAQASISGALVRPAPGQMPTGSMAAEADIDLAALARHFPHTLRLKEGLTIESGALALNATFKADAKGAQGEAELKVENLAAVQGGRRIEPEAPIMLQARVSIFEGVPKLDSLRLESSFASVRGRGSLDSFAFELESDLSAAMREAAKFVDLGGIDMRGKASVTVGLEPAPEGSPGSEFSASLQLDDLEVLGLARQPISEKSLTVDLTALALLDEKMTPKEVRDLSLEMKSSLATARLSVERVAGEFLPQKPELTGVRLQAGAELGQLLAFVRNLVAVPNDLEVQGRVEVNCEASAAKGVLSLSRLEAVLTNLEVARAGKTMRQPEVRMTATAEALLARRRATVHSLEVATSSGNLSVSDLQLPDWSRVPEGISGKVSGNFDIAKVLESMKGIMVLPEGTEIAGALRLEADAETTAETQKLKLLASLDSLKLTMPDVPTFEEERIELSGSVSVTPKKEELTFDDFQVVSSLLDLKAKGSLSDWADTKLLRVGGTMGCDFERIASLASSLAGQNIELSGKEARPFQISTSLKGADWREILRGTIANAEVRIRRAKVMGIETGEIALAVQAKEAKAEMKIDTTANQGKLSLAPVLDLSGEKPILTLPKDSRILDRVQLTDHMTNELLALALPVFKGSLRVQGKVSFDCNSLNVPLDETFKQEATMAGKLSFEGVQFSSTGVLDLLLAVVKLSGRSAKIPDQEVTISLKDGRFHQNRMRIEVGEYALVTSGSVGLDNTLDLLIELPITEHIVPDKRVYELLKDETLKLRVGGTSASPKLDRDIVGRNLRTLIKGAGKKLIERETRKIIERGLQDLLKRR